MFGFPLTWDLTPKMILTENEKTFKCHIFCLDDKHKKNGIMCDIHYYQHNALSIIVEDMMWNIYGCLNY